MRMSARYQNQGQVLFLPWPEVQIFAQDRSDLRYSQG
jgi:hypothetical protein